jgi:hypothetical protein
MMQAMTSNDAFEWAVNQGGPRLTAAEASWPTAQLGRWAPLNQE